MKIKRLKRKRKVLRVKKVSRPLRIKRVRTVDRPLIAKCCCCHEKARIQIMDEDDSLWCGDCVKSEHMPEFLEGIYQTKPKKKTLRIRKVKQ